MIGLRAVVEWRRLAMHATMDDSPAGFHMEALPVCQSDITYPWHTETRSEEAVLDYFCSLETRGYEISHPTQPISHEQILVARKYSTVNGYLVEEAIWAWWDIDSPMLPYPAGPCPVEVPKPW